MTDQKMTTKMLAQKVAWEGGIVATLDYGISPSEIEDPEVADIWSRLYSLYNEMGPLMTDLDKRLRQARSQP